MRLFDKVAIVGTGLIGGSIALAIKKKQIAKEVIGISRHRYTLALAKKIHAIDKGSLDLEVIKDADLVILATPVNTILNLAPRISKIIKGNCIVIDVGSTKQEIVAKLSKVFTHYLGAHPLAGSEKRGIVNATADLFKDSLCILTPTKNTDKKTLRKITRLWVELGAEVDILSANRHDKILSFTSHLPHIVAFSLIKSIPQRYLKFASGGLKDTTRIAGSESELWSDIFLSNRKNILGSIRILENNLEKIKSAITRKDKRRLNRILKKAKEKRDNLI
ncbi:MAG: prephenate dehydrogenase/arogenate dehydrogenase family protein [Candidatus Omnitrophica bacterium]|nr:prephenate dehydrogenase/arogenate dehydrogenase family protein [Candidatus Omnitrophota bacterium]